MGTRIVLFVKIATIGSVTARQAHFIMVLIKCNIYHPIYSWSHSCHM